MQMTLTAELLILFSLLLLFIATIWDIYKHIIPNAICLAILFCGIAFQVFVFGWVGIIYGISGLLFGFFLFIPFYIAGGMAAGDVKLMAAIGTILGPEIALLAACLSLIAGSFLALILVLLKGNLLILLQRYFRILKTFLKTLQLVYEKPKPDEAAALRFPYTLAISAGTLIALAHQSQIYFYHLELLFSGGVL